MAIDLESPLVIGISTRALFDLEEASAIFERDGLEAFKKHQLANEGKVLAPGTAYHLVKGLLALNQHTSKPLVEIIIMSKNSPDMLLRINKSLQHHELDIERAAYTSGAMLTPYLDAFSVDLYLSMSIGEVKAALDAGFAAAQVMRPPEEFEPDENEIRIAFDGDAVLFSEESERIFQEEGLEAFVENEVKLASKPLPEGPFAPLLMKLAKIRQKFEQGHSPLRLALVTARGMPAHERVLLTFRAWGVGVDEAFFMGGVDKTAILKAFRADIFFDDQEAHVNRASNSIPSGRVPSPDESE